MIGINQHKTAKLENLPGRSANESVFGGDVRSLRSRKVIRIPSKSRCVKIEQAWNSASRNADVIKITIDDRYAIVKREDLEEGMFAMTQDDEDIKYINPKKIITPI